MMTASDFDPMGLVVPPDDLAALRRLATNCRSLDHALEVGSWAGQSTLALASLFERVWAVDTWEGSPWEGPGACAYDVYPPRKAFQTFCKNIGVHLLDTVIPCVGRSLSWASVWTTPLDLVFIDADHRYEAVKADIKAWLPHIRPGGILCGHDFGDSEHPGVTQAVTELVPRFKTAGRSLWWFQVNPHHDPQSMEEMMAADWDPPSDQIMRAMREQRDAEGLDRRLKDEFWPKNKGGS